MKGKKWKIAETARELFMKFGIKRVSIEELCQESGVSKGTFYKHFRNKSDLAKFVFSRMMEDAMQEYRDLMNSNVPYTEKVQGMIHNKLKNTRGMSKEFIGDILNGSDEELRLLHRKAVAEGMAEIIHDLKKAQEKGELRKNMNIRFINYFLNHMMLMIQDPQLQALYNNSGEVIEELTNFFFYGVLPCSGEGKEE